VPQSPMCWYEVLTRTYGCSAYTSGSYATASIHECAAHQRYAADLERWVVTHGNAPYGGTLTRCIATRYNARYTTTRPCIVGCTQVGRNHFPPHAVARYVDSSIHHKYWRRSLSAADNSERSHEPVELFERLHPWWTTEQS
jgi:hypothetical protein